MSDVAVLTLRELLDYSTAETRTWRAWLASRPPAVLDLPVGTGRTATVRRLIHHLVVVERRYADRLHGEAVTDYETVPDTTVDLLFDAFEEARRRLEAWVSSASSEDLLRHLEFTTLSAGPVGASARKVVIHALLHGIRHWAQIATALRQHGYATDWQHDLLMSDAIQ